MAQTNHSDDVDQLLDSALDDFQTPNLVSSAKRFCDLRYYFDPTFMRSVMSLAIQGRVKKACLPKGLGLGLPDLRCKKEGKQKESHVSETLNKLREQTRETIMGLESITGDGFGYDDDAMMEDWVNQFEELTGSQELESMMEAMMQQILSKQVLHEPMKEIEEKYPKWLQENKFNQTEYNRNFYQHNKLTKDLNTVYETVPGNFDKIAELMQKMQECGQPPNDIVKELAPHFDISTLGKLSQEMLDSQGNCCIM